MDFTCATFDTTLMCQDPMVLENVLVAFFMPKGMIVQSNKPNLVIKVDLWMFSKAILICENPNCRSNVETIMICPIEFKHLQPRA